MTDFPLPSATKRPSRFKTAWDSDFAYAFRKSPVAIISATMVFLLMAAAVFAPLIAPFNPFDPASLNLMNGFTPPSEANAFTGDSFLMGTDDQGRDVFSTILYGMRISLFVGFAAVLFALVLGVTLGLIAGYVGGWTETLIMRIADVQLTFPSILVAMLITGVAKGFTPVEYRDQLAIVVLIVAIGLSDWVQFARVVRGATLVERNKEYVQAARLIGRSGPAIMVRHILPNVLSPVLVIATISLALAIIAEATLSFLGVGAPPTQPSLGTLIRIGQDYLFSGEWWILFFPAVTLLALALSVNLLGDWLRDALNPRLR
ncbi:ABC transporter permease [Litoreibacter roseus]|uniref:Peptide ABC transporter permease n=1 Tax=Litoreibacter roseus TaxID=2601869 RepID=A0A6N6JJ87_9RHOB|nr:ABC transporter permease [Litoreibacter roseus]GFE66007.1 peptide ABC transporter permease [Litoreibacter roseus]